MPTSYLMQMHSSYVVTDPKGTVLVECGKMLEKGGYVIKSLNTINFRKSMHYNPFAYIRSEKDILKLVNTIILNTKGDGDKSGEDFWVKAEKLYYTALIGYIWYEAPDHEKNFTTLLEMINASEAREDDETFKNPVDVMFDELEARDPDHFAVKQYRKYKLAAGRAVQLDCHPCRRQTRCPQSCVPAPEALLNKRAAVHLTRCGTVTQGAGTPGQIQRQLSQGRVRVLFGKGRVPHRQRVLSALGDLPVAPALNIKMLVGVEMAHGHTPPYGDVAVRKNADESRQRTLLPSSQRRSAAANKFSFV